MFWAVEVAANVIRRREPRGIEVISSGRRSVIVRPVVPSVGVAAPPSVTTISLPSRRTALSTATRWLYPVRDEMRTRSVGTPNVSTCGTGFVVRTTFPPAVSLPEPANVNLRDRVTGRPTYDFTFRLHGSAASTMLARDPSVLGTALTNRSNHARTSPA